MDPYLIATFAGIAGAFLGTLLTAIFNRGDKRFETKLDAQQKLYDQLQEDLNAERRQRETDVARIHDLLGTTHIQSDYIAALRQHISDEKPPPPPEWPEGLGA